MTDERLLLDEMFAPRLAEALRSGGHDVVAVAADPGRRALPDGAVYALAAAEARRIVTENVPDFQRLHAVDGRAPLLCVSSRTFSRSRGREHLLLEALDAWLVRTTTIPPSEVEWLRPGAR